MRTLKITNDGSGKWYLYGNEFGATQLIRADSFESALQLAWDDLPAIADEDIPEAYGQLEEFAEHLRKLCEDGAPCPSENWSRIVDFVNSWLPVWWAIKCKEWKESGQWPELQEGYQMTDGGEIKNPGLYEWMQESTPQKIKATMSEDRYMN